MIGGPGGGGTPHDVPDGWVDLELLHAERRQEDVVLDCVVARIRQLRPDEPASRRHLGRPVALRLHAPVGTQSRSDLDAWLDDEPTVAVLTDELGCLLLLSVDERTVALELHDA